MLRTVDKTKPETAVVSLTSSRTMKTSLGMLTIATAALLPFASANALDVRDAIAQTLESNPQVLTELREVDARERQVRQALAGYYPTVDVVAGFGFQERDPTGRTFSSYPGRTRNELERREAQINARQLVFDGFLTTNEYKNQKSRHESAQHRATSVGENISLEVVRVFTEVLKQESILALAKDTLDFHDDVYARMKDRYDSGAGSRADFDQISSRVALAKTNLQNVSGNLRDARINYQRVVGTFPNEGELQKPGSYRKYLPESVESAISRAEENHPINKLANADLDAVNFLYEQTKAAFYPKFHVEVERDLNDNVDGIEQQVDDLKVMLRMRYNVYNGRADQARKQEFAHLIEKAKEIRSNARREIEQEVRLAWVAHDVNKQQIPVLEDYVDSAVSTKASYEDQFDLGRRTLLDLLNTENETVNARRDLINTQYDKVYNEYRIFQAMGDLMYMVGAKI